MNYTTSDSPNSKCSVCVLGQFCLPVGLSAIDVSRVDALVKKEFIYKKVKVSIAMVIRSALFIAFALAL